MSEEARHGMRGDVGDERGGDLRSELAAELGSTSAPSPLPSAPPGAPLPDVPTAIGTPALSVRLTPLRWSLPRLDSSEQGAGLAVRVGPWRIEITV